MIASAQPRDEHRGERYTERDRDHDNRYYGNSGYYRNNGYYGNYYGDRDDYRRYDRDDRGRYYDRDDRWRHEREERWERRGDRDHDGDRR